MRGHDHGHWGVGDAKIQRRLAAILAADIAGYSALMGADEETTVRDLKAHQSVILPLIPTFSGRVIDTAGDGILAEFSSVLNFAGQVPGRLPESQRRHPSRRVAFRMLGTASTISVLGAGGWAYLSGAYMARPNGTSKMGPGLPKQKQEVKYYQTADGVRLAYAIAGSGPPLVKTGIPGARFIAMPGKNRLMLESEPAFERFIEEIRLFLGVDG